jgi:hypothetical protein
MEFNLSLDQPLINLSAHAYPLLAAEPPLRHPMRADLSSYTPKFSMVTCPSCANTVRNVVKYNIITYFGVCVTYRRVSD